MGHVQDFYTSRDNNVDPETYVGQLGRLWYDPVTNSIYVSDGSTAGGIPVALATNADILANNITVTGNVTVAGNISPATETRIGGVRAGPGANISSTGLLTIDTTGLPLSFGNFTANNNILTIVNNDENMVLATQGSAEIQLVGNIGFYATNGLPPENTPFFTAGDDGQIKILVPDVDPIEGAVEIIGSTSGESISPALSGVMLHITGQTDEFSSLYLDGVNNFPNYIGRRYNGNVVSPTQVLAGNTIVRFSGQGYSVDGFDPPADGSISLDALEDFTETNQGTVWRFLVNPVGGNVRQQVANISVANGVTATQFNTTGNVTANLFVGNLTGSANTANTATDLAAATDILAGTITVDPTIVNRSTASVQTFTLTGLTTNHKIVITSGTALGYGIVITAAWASAANTLSIEFQNFTGNQDINLPEKTIQYFAWV